MKHGCLLTAKCYTAVQETVISFVGDMNEFGTVYMSTVGCGIIYGRLSEEPIPPETSETSETTIPTTTTTTVTTEETGNTIPSGSFDPKRSYVW